MAGILYYAHTVSHLSIRQIAYRLIRSISRRSVGPLKVVPVAHGKGNWRLQPLLRQNGSQAYAFRFLNVYKEFNPGRFDWVSPEMDKLWRYNLHYFDYLQEEGLSVDNKAFLISDWIRHNPQGSEDAWEPFPVSMRIVNWIKFFLGPGVTFKEQWLQSLYVQALWLEKNLEYHLLANHLFKNLKAMIFAGCFFKGKDAERWLLNGLKLLQRELAEQILPDGGHFERSPMYHSMILEDLLDLAQLLESEDRLLKFRRVLKETACRMTVFLESICHPDGQIALFNDAAFGIEPPPRSLYRYFHSVTGETLPTQKGRSRTFGDSGYFVMSPDPANRMIIDCGPIGPDYQPGHAHCDTLSFELSLKGRRIVVDSGCSQYTDAAIRKYNRGNQGHNTITIDDCNQSEVWGAHRCARRAYPLSPKLFEDADALVFEGAHDGYVRLPGRPIHRRRIQWKGNIIKIDDQIEGKKRHTIESRLHIHPDLKTEFKNKTVVIGDKDGPLATISAVGPNSIESARGWYCPGFGTRQKCRVLYLRGKNQSLPFKTGWIIEVV